MIILFSLLFATCYSFFASQESVSLGATFEIHLLEDSIVTNLENFEIIDKISNSEGVKYRLLANKVGKFELINGEKSLNINVVIPVEVKDAFIKVVHPKKIYKGERFLVEYFLYTKREIASSKFRDSLKGFHSIESATKERLSFTNYIKIPLQKIVWNDKVLPKRVLDVEIMEDLDFNGKFINGYVVTEKEELVLLDLPYDVDIIGDVELDYKIWHYQDHTKIRLEFSGEATLDNLKNIYKDPRFEISEAYEYEEIYGEKFIAIKIFNIECKAKFYENQKIDGVVLKCFSHSKGYYEIRIPSFNLKKSKMIHFKYIAVVLLIIFYFFTRYIFKLYLERNIIIKIAKAKSKDEILKTLNKYLLRKYNLNINDDLSSLGINNEVKRLIDEEVHYKEVAILIVVKI